MAKFIVRLWVDVEIEAETAEAAVVIAKDDKQTPISFERALDPEKIDIYDIQVADVRRKSE